MIEILHAFSYFSIEIDALFIFGPRTILNIFQRRASHHLPLREPRFFMIFQRRFDRCRCVDRSRSSKTIENLHAFSYLFLQKIHALLSSIFVLIINRCNYSLVSSPPNASILLLYNLFFLSFIFFSFSFTLSFWDKFRSALDTREKLVTVKVHSKTHLNLQYWVVNN